MPTIVGENVPARDARNRQITDGMKLLKKSIGRLRLLSDDINGEVKVLGAEEEDAPLRGMGELISLLPDFLRDSSDDIDKLVAEIKEIIL